MELIPHTNDFVLSLDAALVKAYSPEKLLFTTLSVKRAAVTALRAMFDSVTHESYPP